MFSGGHMAYEAIHVECYSGYRVNERPTAFTFRDRRHQVLEIVDRWHEGSIDAPTGDTLFQGKDDRWRDFSPAVSFAF